MPSKNRHIPGHIYSRLKRYLKKPMVWALALIVSTFGFVMRDELAAVTKKWFFYGKLEMVTDDSAIINYGRVTVYDGKGSVQHRFQLSSRRTIRLPSGNYLIEVTCPGPDAAQVKIMERPIDIPTRGYVKVDIISSLPNAIVVRLTPSKNEYVRGEQLFVGVTSTRDGYIWLFSPDSQGNPNQLFPNDNFTNNRIKAGLFYPIPPTKGESFSLVTRDTPGQELIVGIVAEENDQAFTYACLGKIVPNIRSKVNVSREILWGYDKCIITVR